MIIANKSCTCKSNRIHFLSRNFVSVKKLIKMIQKKIDKYLEINVNLLCCYELITLRFEDFLPIATFKALRRLHHRVSIPTERSAIQRRFIYNRSRAHAMFIAPRLKINNRFASVRDVYMM